MICENDVKQQSKKLLEEGGSFYHTFFDLAPGPMAITDFNNGYIVDVNEAFVSWSFYSRDEIIGRTSVELGIWPDNESRKAILDRLTHIGRIDEVETLLKRKNGELRLVVFSGRLVGDENHKLFLSVAKDITERKKTEEALRKSEEKYRSLVEATTDWVWEMDSEGKFIYTNNKIMDYLGYTSQEIIGKTPFEFAIPEHGDRSLNIFHEKKPFEHLHDMHRHSNGTLVTLDTSGIPLFDDQGTFVGYRGVTRDITELKKAEEALRKSEEKFRQLSENARDMIYRMSLPDGKYEYISPASFDITGFTPEEHYNGSVSIQRVVHPDFIEYFNQQWEELLIGRAEHFYEYKILHKDGGERWLYQRNTLIHDEKGLPIAIEGIVTDITEQKKAEDELWESREEYRNIFQNSIEGIFRTTPEGRFSNANPAVAHMLGYESPEELISTITDLGTQLYTNPEDRDKMFHLLLRDGSIKNFEVKCRHKNGHFIWGVLNMYLARDGQGNVLYIEGTCQDITDRKHAEEKLQRQAALLEAQTNASIDGILVVDESQRRLVTNQRIVALWDVPQHIMDEEDDTALLKYVTSLARYPEEFIGKVMYLYEHIYDTSRDEIEFKNGMVLDRYSAPVLDEDGHYYGRIWAFRDITERRQAEEELEEHRNHLERLVEERTKELKNSENKYRTLFENANDAILLSKQGILIDCNTKALELFRATRGQIIGQSPNKLSLPLQTDGSNSRKKAMARVDAALSGIPQRFEWQHIRSDGTFFDAEISLYVVHVGEERLLQALIHDITERKRAEKTLLENEEKFRLLFEKSADPILLWDNGVIIDCNDVTLQILRCAREQIIGQDVTRFSPEKQPDGCKSSEKAKEMINHAIKKGSNHFEWVHRTFDGENIWVDISLTIIPLQGRNIIYAVWRDISERKRAEEALKQNENELRIKSHTLEELNIALKVLLQQKTKDEKQLEERFASNASELILPYIEKIKKSRLDERQQSYIAIMEANLNEIISPFLHQVQQLNFTPRETQVANLIRDGKSTKEIADIIGIAPGSVDFYRKNIRDKLNLTNQKINLQSYLRKLTY